MDTMSQPSMKMNESPFSTEERVNHPASMVYALDTLHESIEELYKLLDPILSNMPESPEIKAPATGTTPRSTVASAMYGWSESVWDATRKLRRIRDRVDTEIFNG